MSLNEEFNKIPHSYFIRHLQAVSREQGESVFELIRDAWVGDKDKQRLMLVCAAQ